MKEVTVVITGDAMRELADGQKFAFDLPSGVRVILACDRTSVKHFRDYVRRALLEHLPIPPSIH